MKKLVIIILLAFQIQGLSQQITIHIFAMQATGKKAPLKASVALISPDTRSAVKSFSTDSTGILVLEEFNWNQRLAISAPGHDSDTLDLDSVKVHYYTMLYPVNLLTSVEITFRDYDNKIDLVRPIKVEVVGQGELKKAACCNLAESFESNASVDVVYTDAVTGARTIQMLGLSGLYAPIQIENVPFTRGLLSNYGMSFIPGTWLHSIQITKGVGSVINGFESMSGMINIELVKPENHKTETFFLNGYGSSMGRAEVNSHVNVRLKNNWYTMLMLHGNGNFVENDMNHDGFRDNPLSKQINVMNRWKHQGKKTEQVIMLHYMADDKQGGQLGAGSFFNEQTKYEANISTRLYQLYVKNGFLFPGKKIANLGLIGSMRYHENYSHFGYRIFDAQQYSGYFNAIFNDYIGNTQHTYKAGASFIYDHTSLFNGINSTQEEYIPGAFFEYSYTPDYVFSLLVGQRVDYHNQFGLQYTPRIHLKYSLTEKISMRALAGTGFRTSKTIMENISALASSRIILIEPNLLPEKSWNAGVSYTQEFKVGEHNWMFNADYYYTEFLNQVVVDYDKNPRELNIYNLTGRSFAHSFQVDLDMLLTNTLQVRLAYKHYDVKQTVADALQPKAMVSPNRIMGNVSWHTENKKWKIDLINNWIDAARIPSTKANPVSYKFPERGEPLYIAHVQVTKLFRKFEAYMGIENILDKTQHNAIIAENDPFGTYFDASMIWGPLNGRVFYFGFRYGLKR